MNNPVTKTVWRCPSNIAIVKYWGKKENQIPCNSSLSLTLSKSFTEIECELLAKKSGDGIELEYFFEGRKSPEFENRIRKYLYNQAACFPFLKDHRIKINSKNSFPHSAGIASSASAFGALAVSLLDISDSFGKPSTGEKFLKKASQLARLGSGSACRSLFGGFVLWGVTQSFPASSNEFATPVGDVHKNFKHMHDAILIVDESAKEVSSSLGHSLMNQHFYATNRFAQANQRASQLLKVLASGDFEEFIPIAESEALTLHAMMMTSANYYLLLKPGTLMAIDKIMAFRKDTKIPVCFTLDAGPNVHVLYADDDKEKVEKFLNLTFENSVKRIIFDQAGNGPGKIS